MHGRRKPSRTGWRVLRPRRLRVPPGGFSVAVQRLAGDFWRRCDAFRRFGKVRGNGVLNGPHRVDLHKQMKIIKFKHDFKTCVEVSRF